MNWTPEQYNELTALYREMSDSELRRLANAPEELTDVANEVMTKEVAARGLKIQAEPDALAVEPPEDVDDEIDNDLWFHYALKAPEHCSFDFEETQHAWDAHAFLEENHIAGYVLVPQPDAISIQGPRLVVRPRDAERARLILSQPIPERIANEPVIKLEDFVVPICPHCGALDPMLTSIEPTNHWECEACGQEWNDELPEDGE